MEYINNSTDFYSDLPSAVTLGKFDGLHRGHQKLINKILDLKKEGLKSIVFTIAPENIPVLLTPREKRTLLEQQGADCLIRCPFVPEILGMEPEQFISEILIKRLRVKHIVVGTDFRFGYKRAGDVCLLQQLQDKYDFKVHIIEKERFRDREISSTYVKEALAEADVALANQLLGYEYSVSGTVQHGHQLGRKIGMPTINLVPDKRKILPPSGVYYSRVYTDERKYNGITNIGYKPTVDGSFLGVETYLYGTREELYDREVRVSLAEFRRAEQKFDSVDALKAQMHKDIRAGEEYFYVG